MLFATITPTRSSTAPVTYCPIKSFLPRAEHLPSNLPSIARVPPETASTIYRHLSRTIGAWEQATFRDVSTSIGRNAACERRHRPLLRIETARKKVPASNSITPCLTATIHEFFYRHDTALKASVFRKAAKMATIKCLKCLLHRGFFRIFLPSGPSDHSRFSKQTR
jgi:hypothetical protein